MLHQTGRNYIQGLFVQAGSPIVQLAPVYSYVGMGMYAVINQALGLVSCWNPPTVYFVIIMHCIYCTLFGPYLVILPIICN